MSQIGICLRTLKMENNVRSVEFCDERVLTGDEDGYITFWDMKTLKHNTGEDVVASYRAHNTYVEVETTQLSRTKN